MTVKLFFNAFIKFLIGIILIGVLLFFPAGSLNYFNGWLFMAVLFIPMFFIGLIMMSSEANSDGTDSPNKLWGADISMEITGFSNTDGNGNLISDELISGEMRYLTIDYKLEWIAEKPDSPLYLAIYNSEGNVEDQSTSDGRRWFVRTDGYTLDMPLDEGYRWVAWNWMYGKSETPYGNYRVEFWYEGEIIATDTVYIYP